MHVANSTERICVFTVRIPEGNIRSQQTTDS